MSTQAIVEQTDQETIEKLKKRWKRVEDVAEGFIAFNAAGFFVSLTPLDDIIDLGLPIIEIVSGALLAASIAMKQIAKKKVAEYEGQEYSMANNIPKEEIENMKKSVKDAVDKTIEKRNQKKALQKSASNE